MPAAPQSQVRAARRSALVGLFRLIHPFPILLDGIVSAAVAVVAGGDGLTVLRLGIAMIALQASIGSLNDLVDAPTDVESKPGKPLPAGIVSPVVARMVVVGSGALGLALTAPSGPGLLLLAALGLAIGYGYDLAAKGTAWSWVPFALGIPLLPVFGWFGVTGALPAPFLIVLPTAVAAGTGLAIANAMADMDRDRAAGVASVAIGLGPRRAWAVAACLQSAVCLIAIGSLWAAGAATVVSIAATAASGLVLAGLAFGRGASPRRLERAWEVQAVGIAVLGAAWLWGIARPG